MTPHPEPLKDYYERTSARFWDPLEGMVGRDRVVFPLLDGLSGNCLEYGFGSASLLFGIAREPRFTSVTGVEISERCIEAARQRLATVNEPWAKKVRFVVSNREVISEIEDGTIDVVVCVATIEHVLNPYVVLDELHRVATSRATMICSVPNYAYLKHRLALVCGKLPKTGTDEPVRNWRNCGWDGMHLHTFTKAAFTTLLENCG
jgi:2-polyprenyl-3-methyl-5-hydroxy-6-metoxy-1,4-benzoquinol methylase